MVKVLLTTLEKRLGDKQFLVAVTDMYLNWAFSLLDIAKFDMTSYKTITAYRGRVDSVPAYIAAKAPEAEFFQKR